MKRIVRVVSIAFCLSGLLLPVAKGAETAAGPPGTKAGPAASVPALETRFEVTDRYTAQRRPRVAVLGFDNTNTGALKTKYGSAVEAMLVTFLKRKSQFVVVERQKLNLDRLLSEKERLQIGMVKVSPNDTESQALLEKIDVFVLGSVTLLATPTSVKQQNAKKEDLEIASDSDFDADEDEDDTDFELDYQSLNGDEEKGQGKVEKENGADPETEEDAAWGTGEVLSEEEEANARRAEKRGEIQGGRIEIDVKLISRFDGRIIAAAQRSGPLTCLRSIVERLGIALEQEFLRPYYGKLKVTLDEPEHIRVFLTPILPENALDEEKPPTERSTTVTIAGDHDIVEPWTTDPTTYTIKNVLSGWYSMRVERPGYSEIGVENARWEVRRRLGKEVVYDRVSDRPLDNVDFDVRRFVVRVDPLATEVIDGEARKFVFRKEGGSIAPVVRRQYLDTDFSRAPQRVILIGDRKIELNLLQRPDEYADDEKCDLFLERKPKLANYGRTYVAAGQSFDFDQFTGGELILEDYRGEVLPVGEYRMALWEPSYKTEKSEVTVRDRDEKKMVKTSLTRETATLALTPTGPRPANQVTLVGSETRHEIVLPLDFEKSRDLPGLPADGYVTSTNIDDLDGWQGTTVVLSLNVRPPVYDPSSKRNTPRLIEAPRPKTEPVSHVGVKTRFGLAGRLDTLSRRPDPLAADLFIDEDFLKILNLLLYGVTDRPGEERGDFWKAAAEAGRILSPVASSAISVNGWGTVALPSGKAGAQASLRTDSGTAEKGAEIDPVSVEKRTPPPSDPFPRDPDLLRKLLAARLEVLDLIVLDPVDMAQLRKSPEVAGILARYVASGGSIFAYVSAVGDYGPVIGSPLTVDRLSRPSRRLDLSPGEVEGLIPRFDRKEVKVKAKRALPEVENLPASWRTLAYTRQERRPRIIETAGRQTGSGYVALWLDDPQSFRSRWGGTRPKVEETRAGVEAHVLQRARAMMHQRFDRPAQAVQPCTPPTPPSP